MEKAKTATIIPFEEARVLEENEVQQFLLKYDVGAYEKIFEKLEEA